MCCSLQAARMQHCRCASTSRPTMGGHPSRATGPGVVATEWARRPPAGNLKRRAGTGACPSLRAKLAGPRCGRAASVITAAPRRRRQGATASGPGPRPPRRAALHNATMSLAAVFGTVAPEPTEARAQAQAQWQAAAPLGRDLPPAAPGGSLLSNLPGGGAVSWARAKRRIDHAVSPEG
jgi:hypothetical protein